MLFKYVILVTFVANSFTDNHLNEVEPSTVAYSKYTAKHTPTGVLAVYLTDFKFCFSKSFRNLDGRSGFECFLIYLKPALIKL